MASKTTLAIIGANNTLAQTIAKQIASQYDLLLMDVNANELQDLAASIKTENSNASVEVIGCSQEASWQADAVILVVSDDEVEKIAARIKQVTTRKPVIHFSDSPSSLLTSLLLNANMVNVVLQPSGTNAPSLIGTDAEALKLAQNIITTLGVTL